MKIIFFGTPDIAATILQAILDSKHTVCAVVTQPDRAKGRSGKKIPPPVKTLLLRNASNIPIYQHEKVSTQEMEKTLKEYSADIFVVVAYGEILRQNILDIPPYECINVHASLLPKYRGAGPVQHAIINGETESGISIMYLVKKMDAGDVILQKKCTITDEMNSGDLLEVLAKIGTEGLLEALDLIDSSTAPRIPQDEDMVTIAPKLTLEDGLINWERDARKIYNRIRGVSPKPGAWCNVSIKGTPKRLKILEAQLRIIEHNAPPGTILEYCKGNITIASSKHAIALRTVQLEGKKPTNAQDFINGTPQNTLTFN